ncbi:MULTISPECIES: baseplate J/gp47 family protein [Marinobacter]|uniref:Baseplate J/gp47 family protein n=1 Tax=Marinobacter xiaoshiensis TaxID=3073652 RepID=A0ABU2HI75_9GAMM|nr:MULTISPECIES: baseplate J/gp47 family protein [unclassified Marinobacter]MBK1888288.1 baseplate J/gp47 family protein [Marinobacter sp. DY40_1A1]MDS1310764.1 baseplate J/gp47 family protein [Marinobacter sp. F60267]
MPLPVPNLDDRRFDDLVKEARERLGAHLPELTQISPGDPIHTITDLFAWFTETILYRANLIPERQRRAFLNLLQVPVRPAKAATGVVCIDSAPGSASLPALVRDGAQLRGGKQFLTASGELQPTNLSSRVLIKEVIGPEALGELGITPRDLKEQFGLADGQEPTPFRPRQFSVGRETLALADSLDQALYVACVAPKALAGQLSVLRDNLAGIVINIAIAPADDQPDDLVDSIAPRTLVWELVNQGNDGRTRFLPLEIIADSSGGGRLAGVVRLRIPRNPHLLQSFTDADPMFTGFQDLPPALEDPEESARTAFWLRLRCPDEPGLALGYLDLNGVDVVAQGLRTNQIVGMGTGMPDQVIVLPDNQVDAASIQLQVEENGHWRTWEQQDFLAGQSPEARVYRLNPQTGYVYFGDGVSAGKRVSAGVRVRALEYRYGGGQETNLPAGSIKEIVGNSSLRVRHLWPLTGGRDAETVEQAEKRIPKFLTHRNRAVTAADFKVITEGNPVNPVARAEIIAGFLPGGSIHAVRRNVPGAISVFVLPPLAPALGSTPRPTRGLLKDVFGYLLERITIGTELNVLSPEFIPVAVSVRVEVRDRQTEQQTLQNIRDALIRYLWPLAPGGADGEGWPMGRAVSANELATQVARVNGVQSWHGLALYTRPDEKAPWQPLDEGEQLALSDYQLPELLGVRIESGAGSLKLPDGIGPASGEQAVSVQGIAVPVIPDLC